MDIRLEGEPQVGALSVRHLWSVIHLELGWSHRLTSPTMAVLGVTLSSSEEITVVGKYTTNFLGFYHCKVSLISLHIILIISFLLCKFKMYNIIF
jgi:hypothetical protein